MKKLLLFLLGVICYSLSLAQGMGIGTTTPAASAALDIQSHNKGLLIPRLTSIQRAIIQVPANGLLVYDTTLNRLYQYQNGDWRYLIDDSYWRASTSRKFVYNSSDSVGIGITSPTERVDVNGNIRTRDDLIADGRVTAAGTVSGGNLQSAGTLTVTSNALVGGNFTASGNLSTNSELSINNSTATLQLKSASVDKGFVQLSGDNLRLGTNSSNTDGRIIFRSGGVDRMTFFENGSTTIGGTGNAPATVKLRVAGDFAVDNKAFLEEVNVSNDLVIGGKVKRLNTTMVANFLPLCFGTVRAGVLQSSSGNLSISWSWDDGPCGGLYLCSGYFTINSTNITANSTITVTPNVSYSAGNQNYVYTTSAWCAAGKATVRIQLLIVAAREVHYPREDFSFVIYE
jgi:hypothetical protein